MLPKGLIVKLFISDRLMNKIRPMELVEKYLIMDLSMKVNLQMVSTPDLVGWFMKVADTMKVGGNLEIKMVLVADLNLMED